MYKTSDIAKIAGIHPNTVRFYERLGLITPVPRDTNGYRLFDHRHLTQVRVLRCIYLDDWPGEAIRTASMELIKTLKNWNLSAARISLQVYRQTIAEETVKARQAIDILRQWSEKQAAQPAPSSLIESVESHSRTEAAAIIGVTPEALRNWERNDLIRIPRQGLHQTRCYGPREMERLKVIYLLRQSRFSLSAIHRCLALLDAGQRDGAMQVLKHPREEDIVWTGDQWLNVLQRTAEKAAEIEDILHRLEKNKTLH